MDGYDETTYGERFAEVYDDWYGDITDTEACVATVADLAAGGPILELGVGTGRLAVPLADRGLRVTGVDSSPAMLEVLAAKPGGAAVRPLLGDMSAPDTGDERFAVVLIAYNTLFNLTDDGAQARCFRSAAERLTPGGCFVVEAFVPDTGSDPSDVVTPKQVTADKVVLSVSRSDPARQEIVGQFVDLTDGAGVRLRPWHLRWATVDQLDALAADAGLRPTRRWSGWDRAEFGPTATTHVTVYRRA